MPGFLRLRRQPVEQRLVGECGDRQWQVICVGQNLLAPLPRVARVRHLDDERRLAGGHAGEIVQHQLARHAGELRGTAVMDERDIDPEFRPLPQPLVNLGTNETETDQTNPHYWGTHPDAFTSGSQ